MHSYRDKNQSQTLNSTLFNVKTLEKGTTK